MYAYNQMAALGENEYNFLQSKKFFTQWTINFLHTDLRQLKITLNSNSTIKDNIFLTVQVSVLSVLNFQQPHKFQLRTSLISSLNVILSRLLQIDILTT